MSTTSSSLFERIYHLLGMINDVLLIPMFLMLVNQLSSMSLDASNETLADWVINALFFTEWLLGFMLASERKSYFFSVSKMLDLISCLPLVHCSEAPEPFGCLRL